MAIGQMGDDVGGRLGGFPLPPPGSIVPKDIKLSWILLERRVTSGNRFLF